MTTTAPNQPPPTQQQQPSTKASPAVEAQLTNAPTNPRGIPRAPFVDNVADYVSSRAEVEGTLKRFQEMIQKYQFMEASTQRRLQGLKEKVPDIQKTADMVSFLLRRNEKADADEVGEEQEPLECAFELNETLFARAEVPRTEEVYLWLGANVMLSYGLGEARELLEGKLEGAKGKLRDCEEDVEFLREQITTLEVATARVYNWDVTQRRKEKEANGENKT